MKPSDFRLASTLLFTAYGLDFPGGLQPCVERRFQRVAQAPDADIVEVERIRMARLQGFDAQMPLGDLREEVVEGVDGVSLLVLATT